MAGSLMSTAGRAYTTVASVSCLNIARAAGSGRRDRIALRLRRSDGAISADRSILAQAATDPIVVGTLASYDRPLPDLGDYDTLLSGPCAGTA